MWAIAPFLRHTIAFLTADCKGNMYFCKEIAMAILVPKREKSKLVAFNYFEIVDCKQLKNFLNFHIILSLTVSRLNNRCTPLCFLGYSDCCRCYEL